MDLVLLVRIGVNFSDDELLEMVQEADIDGDQHVSFEEFSNIFNEGWFANLLFDYPIGPVMLITLAIKLYEPQFA